MVWSLPLFYSSQEHTQKLELMEWNKNRGIKKVQGAMHISEHLIIPLLVHAILLHCTSSSRFPQGNPVMERTRDPRSIINPRASTGSYTERVSRRVRGCFCTSQLALSHCLSGTSHLGAAALQWGRWTSGLGTGKLPWPDHGEGMLVGEGCSDSQVH